MKRLQLLPAVQVMLLFGVFCVDETWSINCYVCDTSDTSMPFQCSEWFDRFDKPDIMPQNCSNVHDAKYCIKHIGRFEGGIGAKRFCSSKDLGNYCDYVQNKGDRMDYRSCIYTCNSDGCNKGNALFYSTHSTIVERLASLLKIAARTLFLMWTVSIAWN